METIAEAASPTGAGMFLEQIRYGRARTRADLITRTGISRTTVGTRLEELERAGLITQRSGSSTGGRPAATFTIRAEAGVLLAIDVGGGHVRVALTDMTCHVLGHVSREISVGEGPQRVLEVAVAQAAELFQMDLARPDDVRAVGIGLPGPVDPQGGMVVKPPIMTGWDGTDVRHVLSTLLTSRLGVDQFAASLIAVNNDVNCMALAEHRTVWPQQRDLLFVKAGTGIGSGMVLGGRLHRGADGSAGDIGHMPATMGLRGAESTEHAVHKYRAEAPLCRCGAVGCVEAFAGGWALAEALRAHGPGIASTRDVIARVQSGDAEAGWLLREAGRFLGYAVADAVGMVNPGLVVLGGALTEGNDVLIAGVREIVYMRAPALATRRLRIVTSELGQMAGPIGGANLAADMFYAPERVDKMVAAG